MFITKKHLSRRTFLQAAGATVALPFLDSMVGAQTPIAGSAAAPKTRLACFYVPHGATMDKWTPTTEGTGFAFTEILKPLEPYRRSRERHQRPGASIRRGRGRRRRLGRREPHACGGGVPHRLGAGAWRPAHLGVSADQVAARHIGQDTPLPSLELSIEESVLNCEATFSCAYRNSISWQSPDAAAADAEQPPAGVREAVRRRQHRRGASRPSPGDAKPARLRDRSGGVAEQESPGRRPSTPVAVSRRCPRDRAAHSARGSVGVGGREPSRRAERRAADLCGASQAPDGSAGDRVSVADHARVDADVRARAEHAPSFPRPASAIRSTTCRITRTTAPTWIGSPSSTPTT